MSKITLKKLIKQLAAIKGRHTELVTVYVPAGYSLTEIANQLRNEQGTSENIKSKQVRKNVTSALDKIVRNLALYKRTPENGMAIFCGNVSEKEGAADLQIWTIEPPEPVKTKLYWCDQKFVTEPLEDMIAEKEVYGIINLDKGEATIALLKGKRLETIFSEESIVPGKSRAGGQCLSPDTLVQMSDGNILEMKDLHNPCVVKSADFTNLTLKDTPVLEKWNSEKPKKYTITTKFPRMQIESSADHTFFKWGNSIEDVAAEHLKEGDYLLMPEKIEVKGAIQSLDTSLLFNSYKITESGRKFLKNRREKSKLFQKGLAKKISVTQTAISAVELGKRFIKRKFLEKLCAQLEIDTKSFVRQHCEPVSNLTLPNILDEKLAEFLGYFAGDGSFEKERLSLHDASEQIASHYMNIGKTIFNCKTHIRYRENKAYYISRLYGKPIVNLLKTEFSELKYAGDTEIPRKILTSPNSVLAAFLRGFFDAEGYVNINRGIGLGINNKKMAKQIQISLLRFGILASLVEYDNRRNPYSKKHRFTIQITERTSLEIFLNKIGFNAKYKQEKLKTVIKTKSIRSNVRQIFATGENIRKIIESCGYKISDFPKVTNFFRNERLMSKEVFSNSILSEIKHVPELYTKLKIILEYNIVPVKIKSIEVIQKEYSFVDIEVKNSNFIANGLVVHNSSQRFSRIREGLLNDWLKKVGEAANKIFGEHKVLGILLSGGGPVKEMLYKEDYMHADVKNKILGLVDTSYTGDQGLEETIIRGEHLIKEAGVIKEKKMLQRFLEELQKPSGLAVYGLEKTLKIIEMGAAETILVMEDSPLKYAGYECACGKKYKIVKDDEKKKQVCGQCNAPQALVEEKDALDALEDLAENYGTKFVVISADTREGKQFEALGGVGAFLRYRI
ncbi:MAG TPA: LAGLIDADG family homing endonuclease [archaeon]|nr:LAGLIDADG family homing endonuclease [archaeon]